MRIRAGVRVLVGAFAICLLATPAAAQVQTDIAAGYQFFRILDGGGMNMPTGWGVSFAGGKEWVKGVADFGGSYRDGLQIHTFQGGVEFSGKAKRVVPFARLLAGMGLFTCCGGDELEATFVLTPEAGVKIMANDRVGFQTSVGFPWFTNGDGSLNGLRWFAGIVIRR